MRVSEEERSVRDGVYECTILGTSARSCGKVSCKTHLLKQ